MRPLSLREADRCENAKSPASQCRCRCRGAFHGKGRIPECDRGLYEALPENDPHRLPAKERKRSFTERLAELREREAGR